MFHQGGFGGDVFELRLGPGDADGGYDFAFIVVHGRTDTADADFFFFIVDSVAQLTNLLAGGAKFSNGGDGVFVVTDEALLADEIVEHGGRQVGDDGFAESGAVQAHALADPGGQSRGSVGFDAIDEDDLTLLHHGKVHGGAGVLHEAMEERGAMTAQGMPGERHVRQRMQAGAKTVSPSLFIALHVSAALIREEKGMPGTARQLKFGTQLG